MRKVKTFVDNLIDLIYEKESILCVGLDPQVRFFPEYILQQGYNEAKDKSGFEPVARAIVIFNQAIIEAVVQYTVVVKPQRAFYEAYGPWGVWAFKKTVETCKSYGLLVLEDAKRCDGGDTAESYAAGHLGEVNVWNPDEDQLVKVPSLNVDAMTIMPGIGSSCVNPFLESPLLNVRSGSIAAVP